MKFKLFEDYDYALDDLRSLVQEYIYDAIDDLGSASLDKYITWYIEEFRGYDIDIDLLEKVVTDKYIEAIDTGKIKADKTNLTSELKQYLVSNKHLINDIDELIRQCPEHLQHELKLVIDIANLNESLNEELLTEVQSVAQRQENKKYKKKIHNLDNSILESDYVVHHIDKTKKIKLENGETIQLTDYSNCVLLPKIKGDSNVIHQAVHGALVCGDLDSYIQTLQQCEVIKENEDNSISRMSLEDFIKNSIK